MQEREVSLTTVSSSDLRKVEVGEIDILVDSGTPVTVSKTMTTGAFAASTLWSVKVAGKREVARALVHWSP